VKGYFSSMAQISGLRIAESQPPRFQTSERTSPPVQPPLQIEEVAVLSPPVPVDHALKSIDFDLDSVQPLARSERSPTGVESHRPPPTPDIQKSPHQSWQATKAVSTGNPALAPSIEPQERFVHEAVQRVAYRHDAGVDPEQKSPARVDEPGPGPEDVVAPGANRSARSLDSATEDEGGQERAPRSPQASAEEGKVYFAKTAASMLNPEVNKSDMQAIVLHEVQEWVAAAPVDRGDQEGHAHGTEPVGDGRDAGLDRVRVVTVRDPALRRIPEVSAGVDSAQTGAAATQNFELSIGTISVSIEEPEQEPRESAPSQTSRPTVSAQERPSFSRISRSYL